MNRDEVRTYVDEDDEGSAGVWAVLEVDGHPVVTVATRGEAGNATKGVLHSAAGVLVGGTMGATFMNLHLAGSRSWPIKEDSLLRTP